MDAPLICPGFTVRWTGFERLDPSGASGVLPVLPWLITDVVVVVFTPAITIHVRFACAGAVQPEPGSLVPAAQLRPMFAARVRSGTASLTQLPLTGRIPPGVGADTLELVVIAAVIDVPILDNGRLRTGFFVLLRPLLLLFHCLGDREPCFLAGGTAANAPAARCTAQRSVGCCLPPTVVVVVPGRPDGPCCSWLDEIFCCRMAANEVVVVPSGAICRRAAVGTCPPAVSVPEEWREACPTRWFPLDAGEEQVPVVPLPDSRNEPYCRENGMVERLLDMVAG
uniref:Uncharacterized protein n=1 Tax=Anopheles coluzzii TaxID=1518534 RepID=A0A8W7PR74_ANOCL